MDIWLIRFIILIMIPMLPVKLHARVLKLFVFLLIAAGLKIKLFGKTVLLRSQR